jgi:fused signal recognition particle receptor
MQQLDKIRRVVGKQVEGAPHDVLLVLDATAGQNAISQARGFSDAAGCKVRWSESFVAGYWESVSE